MFSMGELKQFRYSQVLEANMKAAEVFGERQ